MPMAAVSWTEYRSSSGISAFTRNVRVQPPTPGAHSFARRPRAGTTVLPSSIPLASRHADAAVSNLATPVVSRVLVPSLTRRCASGVLHTPRENLGRGRTVIRASRSADSSRAVRLMRSSVDTNGRLPLPRWQKKYGLRITSTYAYEPDEYV